MTTWRKGRSLLLPALTLATLHARAMPAAASRIGITTEVSATVRGGALAVTVGIANTGDEAATTVVPSAEFGGRQAQGPVRPTLAPGERIQTTIDVPWEPPLGQWPLITRVDYADTKGYPFQALQVALVSSPQATAGLLAVIDLDAEDVATSGRIQARLKNLSDTARQADVRFIVPRGLAAEPASRSMSLAPWADVQAEAEIVNRGALAGSRYPVFVTAEHDDPGGHHTAVAHAVVNIVAARRIGARNPLLVAAGLVVVWIALLAWGARRRRHARAASVAPPGEPPEPPPASV